MRKTLKVRHGLCGLIRKLVCPGRRFELTHPFSNSVLHRQGRTSGAKRASKSQRHRQAQNYQGKPPWGATTHYEGGLGGQRDSAAANPRCARPSTPPQLCMQTCVSLADNPAHCALSSAAVRGVPVGLGIVMGSACTPTLPCGCGVGWSRGSA